MVLLFRQFPVANSRLRIRYVADLRGGAHTKPVPNILYVSFTEINTRWYVLRNTAPMGPAVLQGTAQFIAVDNEQNA